jgi:transcription elongation factor Elf1
MHRMKAQKIVSPEGVWYRLTCAVCLGTGECTVRVGRSIGIAVCRWCGGRGHYDILPDGRARHA